MVLLFALWVQHVNKHNRLYGQKMYLLAGNLRAAYYV